MSGFPGPLVCGYPWGATGACEPHACGERRFHIGRHRCRHCPATHTRTRADRIEAGG